MPNSNIINHAKPEPHGHFVQLYNTDAGPLISAVGNYLWEGLKRGDGLLVVATTEHKEAFVRQLKALGADTEAVVREGRLVFLDAHETLDQFMVKGRPDWELFQSTVGAAVVDLVARADKAGLRAYGEMVGILWTAGQFSAAILLEEFWNKLLQSTHFDLYCAYSIDVFSKEFQPAVVGALLCAHTHLLPGGTNGDLEGAISRAMDEILGSRAEGIRHLIKANFRPSWAAIPKGEAIILWLRNNLPDDVNEILARARNYYHAAQSVTAH